MNDVLSRLDVMGAIGPFGLVLLRTSGLVMFCPVLGSELLLPRVRALLACALAVVLAPVVAAPVQVPTTPLAWGVAGIRELSVGFVIGMAARALFAGIEGAAAIVAGQSGFSLAAMVDPLTGDPSGATVLFQSLLGTALFLAADLHHLFLRGLVHSYAWIPPASRLPDASRMVEAADLLGRRLFVLSVELAAPALVVTFAVDLVMVLVGRALPQVQVLNVGYPAKMAAGVAALSILVAATGSAIGWIGRTFASDAAQLVAALAGR